MLQELGQVGCEAYIGVYIGTWVGMEFGPSGLPNWTDYPKVWKAQRAAPPLGGTARWLILLEANYFFLRISACSAWICLLIDAINATIDFRTSAFDTAVDCEVIDTFCTTAAV